MKCDDLALDILLDADEQSAQHDAKLADVAQHVESCAHCQSRLSELAADAQQWGEAQRWLSESDAAAQGLGDAVYVESLAARERWKRPSAWTESMAKSLLSPASHPEMLGRIGRYDVERLIGSGGMGVVFKAYDTELNRPVAVKLLAPHLASSGAARKRFAREARAAAAVVDEHVVAIHNIESDGQAPFLVMKYIAGGSLQMLLDREGPLEVCEVLRIGIHTAKGLAAAHAQGLIHRDVKPSNILMDGGVSRALLTDFGLARAEDDASLTHSGFHPGTPHYMSPEQVRGEVIDARSDLFGLGSVLYALCTGHPPFRCESVYAVLRRITDDPPRPIRETNPSVPEWLEHIVMKLLAKAPDDRFASASEVAELLEECLAHLQQPITTTLPESVAAMPENRGERTPLPKFFAARRNSSKVQSKVSSNPAKRLLYLLASMCLALSFTTLPTGPPQTGTWIAFLSYGATAIWLARRRFDRVNKVSTLAWGVSATSIVWFAITVVDPVSHPLSPQDLPGTIFVGLCLTAIVAVVLQATEKRAA